MPRQVGFTESGVSEMRAVIPVFACILALVSAVTEPAASGEADRYLDACRRLIGEGRPVEARSALEKFRKKHPDDLEGLYLAARLEEDFDTALAIFREVELLALGSGAARPDSATAARALFARAEMLFSAGRIEEAEELYERLTAFPGTGEMFRGAVYRLGVIALASGEPRRALEKFDTCLDMSPPGETRTLAAAGKMECFVELEDWPEVLASARAVLDEKDENSALTPRVLEVLATAWSELGNEKNAAYFTDMLLNNYPDSYQAHAVREQGNRIAAELARTPGAGADSTSRGGPPARVPPVNGEEPGVENPGNVGLSRTAKTERFSLQAGSFTNRMNALGMYNTLKKAGFDARIEMKTVAGSHRYKVLIGYYDTREEASGVVREVVRETGERPFVVVVE